mmetsp:Transcript_47799/g.57597  ORF Transcript_47799/g.57597 Transcript_47799/m.57597 type:complete len:97 (-) Transcript_47799:370-660(-)
MGFTRKLFSLYFGRKVKVSSGVGYLNFLSFNLRRKHSSDNLQPFPGLLNKAQKLGRAAAERNSIFYCLLRVDRNNKNDSKQSLSNDAPPFEYFCFW